MANQDCKSLVHQIGNLISSLLPKCKIYTDFKISRSSWKEDKRSCHRGSTSLQGAFWMVLIYAIIFSIFQIHRKYQIKNNIMIVDFWGSYGRK